MGKIERFAPAKVNLSLEVTGRRANGYHELQSLVVFARDVGDHLSFSHAKELSIQIDGPFAFGLTAGDENLVLRAAHTLQKSLGLSEGAKVTLTKNLPIASGIGGGLADAAASLLGVRGRLAAQPCAP